MKKTETVLAFIVVFMLVAILAFAFWGGVVWVLAWAFGFGFQWKYVFGAWALSVAFRTVTHNK